METLKNNFWIKWLQTVSVLVALFGLFMAYGAFNQPAEPSPIDEQLNKPFFSNPAELTQAVKDFQSWQYGVVSSTLIAWSVLIFAITRFALAKKERWAWFVILFSLIGWFIIDEPASIWYGVTFNALFNIPFLLAFLLPLLFLRKKVLAH